MKNLVISEKAYDDLLGILRYIARDKPQVAVTFVDQLEEQCKFLAICPESGTKRDDLAPELRVFTYRGYGIYFRNLAGPCAGRTCSAAGSGHCAAILRLRVLVTAPSQAADDKQEVTE